MSAEELEEIIGLEQGMALRIATTNNERLVGDEVELGFEELMQTLPPTPSIPIPPHCTTTKSPYEDLRSISKREPVVAAIPGE